jgi:hypothetical protein
MPEDPYLGWSVSDQLQLLALRGGAGPPAAWPDRGALGSDRHRAGHPRDLRPRWQMTWKPSADIDEQMRKWMNEKGWGVTRTEYDFDREVYAWRSEVRGSSSSPTLRISQAVLEDYPAWAVLYHLDRLRVAVAIRSRPDARYVVAQNGSRVTVEEAVSE